MSVPLPSGFRGTLNNVLPDLDAGDDGDDDEPEPEEHVDLLVDDVERQHAQRVELLHCSRRTELVELALRHLKIYGFI